MKNLLLLVVISGSAIALLTSGCGSDAGNSGKSASATAGGTGTAVTQIKQQTCPVMEGNKINPDLYVDYNGRRIYVCCNTCLEAVKKDPEKYLKKVDEQLAKLKSEATQQK